ncbi:MAG: DUF2304 domain-containing protein [Lachnospira sp.]|nr:DUF2304 domain-containing protein [Lachnospira sp.]
MTPLTLRIIMVVIGILVVVFDFIAYSHKKVTDNIGLGWLAVAAAIILCSVVPGISSWSEVLCAKEYMVFLIFFIILLIAFYKLSMLVSQLLKRNQELAMQVSLLNQENEQILAELKSITGKDITEL